MKRCEEYLCSILETEALEYKSILDILEMALHYNLENLLKTHILYAVAKLNVHIIRGAYERPIKSNIFMAILDLKLQLGPERVHAICKNCYPISTNAEHAVINGCGDSCIICASRFFGRHQEIRLDQQPKHMELKKELLKRER